MTSDVQGIISKFLGQKRIAVIGVSRDARSFSRKLFGEFRQRGYDTVPVNPNAADIDGLPCFASVYDIKPAAEAALLLCSRETTYHALLNCEGAGIRLVWLYGINGPRSVSVGALEFCATHGIEVVPGYCPFMFLPQSGLIHRFHGAVMKMTGSYPR